MIELHQLKKHPKSTKRKKIVGRGLGSGKGTYSTRGNKGQTKRTGHSKMPARFEGGRQPIIRQLPKNRGFKSLSEKTYNIKLDKLSALEDNTVVTMQVLKSAGLIPESVKSVKILSGKLVKPMIIKVAISESAKSSVEKAGGKVK